MLTSRNRILATPLMLCLTQEKIEMFIYVLYKFEFHFQNGGLDCIDIEGNSLLHLAAKITTCRNCLHFTKILIRFSTDSFKKMVNQRNNDGCTPLFVAIQHKNIQMMGFLMDKN
jgi:ankyrin repeat protein